jgi:hypothetical protein
MAGYEDGSSSTAFLRRVGAGIQPAWGISGDVKFSDGDTQFFVGPRFTF